MNMNEPIMNEALTKDPGFYLEIVNWLNREVELLDLLEERQWMETMVSKDIVYQMPLRTTVERARGLGFVDKAFHLDERYGSLDAKVRRNETGLAWAEDPPSRVRHHVSNIRVGERQGDRVSVRSNVLVFRTRQENVVPNIYSGERHDVLGIENGDWRLLKRVIYLDHTAIPAHNLAFFF